ncbi:hypothetical protein HMN09_00853600 [Mycena chlorophos]|uniref:Uncharacterized protein n=1 Tax=Mycena chlorophos TaxID=658473 RepID=A0A8H6SV59_MYCCL|nr:hypothetical protein HMN09_00853600 [Mycena chlorophos]
MSDQWRSNDVKYALGPELIGSAVAVFFQGLLLDQTVNYFALSGRSDKLILRAYVAALTGLLTVNSMLNWASLWHTTITFFGRLQDSSRKVLIFSSGNRILLVFIAFSVQTFFLHRLSQLSKSRVLIVLILCIMLATAVAGLLAPITMLLHCLNPCPPEYLERTEIYYQVHLALLMVTDVLLTCFTAYFLLRIRRIVLPRTAGTINNLLRLCVQTAAPGTLGVFLTFAFSVGYVNPAASNRTFAAGRGVHDAPRLLGIVGVVDAECAGSAEAETRQIPDDRA